MAAPRMTAALLPRDTKPLGDDPPSRRRRPSRGARPPPRAPPRTPRNCSSRTPGSPSRFAGTKPTTTVARVGIRRDAGGLQSEDPNSLRRAHLLPFQVPVDMPPCDGSGKGS
jgi:hypothetical protein